VVQEAFLKWNLVDIDQVRDPRAWLVTVCTRIGLNTLQSTRSRRELYVGTWLPEPFVAAGAPGPEDDLQIDETVSVALMLALERLTPPERAALLLHDVFGHDFDEIAGILGKQSAACRKLASRARARVRDARPKFTASAAEHRRLMTAFVDAARGGRADELRGLLAESVELYADGGGKAEAVAVVLRGPEAVITFLVRVWRRLLAATSSHRVVPTWFNGSPGVLIVEDGVLATALAVSIEGGVIRRIYGHRNPDKLAALAARIDDSSQSAAGGSRVVNDA
jgi:RNA polymerase sigma-70 factor, ECF subfamily